MATLSEINDIFSLVTYSTDLNNTMHNQGNHCVYANCVRKTKLIARWNKTTMSDLNEKECSETTINSQLQDVINRWFTTLVSGL